MTPSTSEIRRIGRTKDRVKVCHVEVWFLDLDAPSRDASRAIDILSEDERRRAAAFHAERNGRRFANAGRTSGESLPRGLPWILQRFDFATAAMGGLTLPTTRSIFDSACLTRPGRL